MIIGNNNGNNRINGNNNAQMNFENRFNMVKSEGQKLQEQTNPFRNNPVNNHHPNVMNQREMADRSFDILQDRLEKGLISLDEFNKKCSLLNKMRKK